MVETERRRAWRGCVRYWVVPALLICLGVLFHDAWDAWVAAPTQRWGVLAAVTNAPYLLWWIILPGAPAWLCGDLLSTRYPANPDPHRDWHPREFLAQAQGRLLAVLPLTSLCSLAIPSRDALERLGPPPINPDNLPYVLRFVCAYGLCFLATGLLAASLAALLSATARRPRRWATAPPAMLASVLTCYLVLDQSALYSDLEEYQYLLVAGALLFGAGLLSTLLTGWIAWTRYRRHPNTAWRPA